MNESPPDHQEPKPAEAGGKPAPTPPTPSPPSTAQPITIIRPRPRWLNSLREALGLRPLPPSVRHVRVAAPAALEQVQEDATALRRALPYAAGALAFACLAALAFAAYGYIAREPTAIRAGAAEPVITQAVSRLEQGDLAGARTLRDQAAKRDPANPFIYFFDGFLLAQDKQRGPAAAAKLAEQTRNRTQAFQNAITLAGYRHATGDLRGSVEALSAAIALAPRNPALRLLRALGFLATGRPAEAAGDAGELEKLGAPPAVVLEVRGRARLALGALAQARHDLEAAVIYNPDSPVARLALAEALWRLGDDYRAYRELLTVLRYNPRNADAFFSIGVLRERRGELQEAERAYRQAVEYNPRHVLALNNLAYLLAERMGRPSQALPFARRAHDAAPDAGPVLDTLGRIHYLLGENDKALALLRRAAAADPRSPDVQMHLAEALLATGAKTEARRILQELARAPEDTPTRRQAQEKLKTLGASGAGLPPAR